MSREMLPLSLEHQCRAMFLENEQLRARQRRLIASLLVLVAAFAAGARSPPDPAEKDGLVARVKSLEEFRTSVREGALLAKDAKVDLPALAHGGSKRAVEGSLVAGVQQLEALGKRLDQLSNAVVADRINIKSFDMVFALNCEVPGAVKVKCDAGETFKAFEHVPTERWGDEVLAAVPIPVDAIYNSGAFRSLEAEATNGNQVKVKASAEAGRQGLVRIRFFVFYCGA